MDDLTIESDGADNAAVNSRRADLLAIAGSLGHADTGMMFERYGHLFNHSAQRVAETADRIFAALDPSCLQLS